MKNLKWFIPLIVTGVMASSAWATSFEDVTGIIGEVGSIIEQGNRKTMEGMRDELNVGFEDRCGKSRHVICTELGQAINMLNSALEEGER